ncbi:conjugative transfer protein TraD [Sulfurifustis variabilis]|uniref:Conjugative transfer protein TraD n=1 Tax=Sulfurifustis variabilis TaxID=1675686 RepID=A0A1B4V7Z3_9GAMM|nr:conjugative transfer system coupling protein TraD [Sulfurifustis variabilis]BAU49648.1 conjugative transfer protein TraD [Sulfurifustis variabilis]
MKWPFAGGPSPREYELAFRGNYEAVAAAGWLAGIAASLAAMQWSGLPRAPFTWMAGVGAVMAAYRSLGASRIASRKRALRGHDVAFIEPKTLQRKMRAHPEDVWLGWGFEWDQPHTQLVHELLKSDRAKLATTHDGSGCPWIHGVSLREEDIYLPIALAEGHTLIVGTTGSGKTTLLALLVMQAILRGEAVIILDPKSDKTLRGVAELACALAGDPQRFVYFHPGFPERSARIDPMRNFVRPTELASRVASNMATEEGADPFKAYSHMALNNVIQGNILCGRQPSLIEINRHLNNPTRLVIDAIEAYSAQHVPDWRSAVRGYLERAANDDARAHAFVRFYYDRVQPDHASPDLEGLIQMFTHNREHHQKMIAGLMPLMAMLTSGHLGRLLSPDTADVTDARPITDSARIIRNGQVAYIGLDTLTDQMVGQAVGSILLADLAAVAGDRYNYGVGLRPVNVFIDEAPECLHDPTIQLLNKSRGSLFRLTLCIQTYGDVEAKLGSAAKARQVVGNLNNTVTLRVLDAESQQTITDGLPKTVVRHVLRTQGSGTQAQDPMNFTGNSGERLMEEEADLFPPALLGLLPNREYLAKLANGKIMKGRLPIVKIPPRGTG